MSDKMRQALIGVIRDQLGSTDYPVSEYERHFADAIMALTAIPTTDAGGKSLAAFVETIHRNAPNGDWIAVKHHPNGDWSVAHCPLPASPTPSTDVGEDEVERVARAIHSYCCRNMVMTYLDAEEDCEGLARAAIAALRKGER